LAASWCGAINAAKRYSYKKTMLIKLKEDINTWEKIYTYIEKYGNWIFLNQFLISKYTEKINSKAYEYSSIINRTNLVLNKYFKNKVFSLKGEDGLKDEAYFTALDIMSDIEKDEDFFKDFGFLDNWKVKGWTNPNLKQRLLIANSKERIIIIESAIQEQRKRIEALEELPELSVFANIWDEKERLEGFIALRNNFRNKLDSKLNNEISDGFVPSKIDANGPLNSIIVQSLTENSTLNGAFQVEQYYKEIGGI
jgi:hypothetical protein